MFEDNVVQFLEHVSRYIGYRYDDLDEAALTGILERTDDESADGWFSYPLPSQPFLTVSLARQSAAVRSASGSRATSTQS